MTLGWAECMSASRRDIRSSIRGDKGLKWIISYLKHQLERPSTKQISTHKKILAVNRISALQIHQCKLTCLLCNHICNQAWQPGEQNQFPYKNCSVTSLATFPKRTRLAPNTFFCHPEVQALAYHLKEQSTRVRQVHTQTCAHTLMHVAHSSKAELKSGRAE